MPAEAVTTQRNVVLTAIVGNAIGTAPIPDTFLGMYGNRFHGILCCNTIEFLPYKLHLLRSRHVPAINGNTNLEVVLISILHTNCCIRVKKTSLPSSPCLTIAPYAIKEVNHFLEILCCVHCRTSMTAFCRVCSLCLYASRLQQLVEFLTLTNRHHIILLTMEDDNRRTVPANIVCST